MYYRDELGNWQEIVLEPSGDTLPIGAITQFGGETAPTNWLFCNGQAISRTDYAELFSAIGTTYGDGDGSTTFNVPDFIGRVPVGLDEEDTDFDTLGETGGSKELQRHNHGFIDNNSNKYSVIATFKPNGSYDSGQTSGSRTYETTYIDYAGTGDSGNLQPYTVTNFIIKAKQSIGIVGTVSEDITDTNNNAVPTCETVKDYVDEKHTYSTTETVIGTYNGKPLYRKEVEYAQINLGTNTTSWDQQLSFTNIKDMFLDTTHSFFVDTDTGLHLPMPYVNPASNTPVYLGYFIEIINGVPTFHLRKSSYIKVWTINLVLEYTKTTD